MSRIYIPRSIVPPVPRPTHVYALGCGTSVKVGLAVDVEARKNALQKACPFEIVILKAVLLENFTAARAIEVSLHQRFAEFRTYGEWFNVPAADVLAAMEGIVPFVAPVQPPAPVREPYVETDPQMARMRAAAKSLEF